MDFQTFQTTLKSWSPEKETWNSSRMIDIAPISLNDSSHPPYANIKEEWAQFCVQHIWEILFRFDRASIFNFTGDGYLTNREFSAMIYKALRIHAALNKKTPIWIDVPNYVRFLDNEMDKNFLKGLFLDLFTEDMNIMKRNFIDFFNDLLEQACEIIPEILEDDSFSVLPIPNSKIMAYFESIFERDYLWNFRPVTNTKNLFRSPNPARYQNEGTILKDYLLQNKISLVVDLRGERERAKTPYCENYLEKLGIECLLVDMNEPPIGEKAPGYVKKLIHQKDAIVTTFRAIIRTPGAALFHCASGKDRTGVMAALLQKIAGISEENVIAEYLTTGHDARPQRIHDVLNYFKKIGGIDKYIDTLGMTTEEIQKLKEKISR